MGKVIDLTGQRFGRLIVIERAKDHINSAGKKYIMWRCKCDCGNETVIRGSQLRSGRTKSCGCLRKDMMTKHGFSKERLYTIWSGMIARCYNHERKDYYNYGGRGVTVCDDWHYSYELFRDWSLNNGYDGDAEYGGCQIDRIDVNGPYSPANCRFVTARDNSNNRRNNLFIEYRGERKTLHQWCHELGLNANTVRNRIYVCKWNPVKAITTPIFEPLTIEFNGEIHTLFEWSNILDVSYSTIYNRLHRGWSTEEAFFGRKEDVS